MKGPRQSSELELTFGEPPNEGWIAATASNGEAYAYHFEGGRRGKGHLIAEVGEGPQYYTVKLKPDDPKGARHKYAIRDVALSGEGIAQLALDRKDASDRHATIYNKNEAVMKAYYAVVVQRDDGVEIECDPMIANEPRH